MTFEQELRLENRLRQEREHNAILKRKINGETIYSLYCVWCNAYGTEEMKTNENCFKEWLNQEREELTFWQEKHLREKYFGYKYTYDNKNQKWEIVKL